MRSENLGRIVSGLFFVVLGIGFLLDQFNILDFGNVIADWWPLIFVGSGVVSILTNPRNWFGGLIMIVVGSVLILSNIVELPFNVWNLWPLVLVFVGLSIIFNGSMNTSRQNQVGGFIKEFVMFWGFERRVRGEFTGASIVVLFGGGELDLRSAQIKDGSEINVTCMFGGVEIKLPDNVRAEVNGTGFLGGFSNNSDQQSTLSLKVSGTAMFGAVEVK
jgi:predicted membrane protein